MTRKSPGLPYETALASLTAPSSGGPEDACMWAQVVTLELVRSYREKGLGERGLDCGWTPSLRRGEPGVGTFLCTSALSFGSERF